MGLFCACVTILVRRPARHTIKDTRVISVLLEIGGPAALRATLDTPRTPALRALHGCISREASPVLLLRRRLLLLLQRRLHCLCAANPVPVVVPLLLRRILLFFISVSTLHILCRAGIFVRATAMAASQSSIAMPTVSGDLLRLLAREATS